MLKGVPSVPGEDRIYAPTLTTQWKVSEACKFNLVLQAGSLLLVLDRQLEGYSQQETFFSKLSGKTGQDLEL